MDEMRKLVERLNETAYQYYVRDEPTISDAEWDKLYDRLVQMEAETGERLPDSPTVRVGGTRRTRIRENAGGVAGWRHPHSIQ